MFQTRESPEWHKISDPNDNEVVKRAAKAALKQYMLKINETYIVGDIYSFEEDFDFVVNYNITFIALHEPHHYVPLPGSLVCNTVVYLFPDNEFVVLYITCKDTFYPSTEKMDEFFWNKQK